MTARPRTGYDANVPSTNPTLEIDHSSQVVAKAREPMAAARRYGVRPGELAELLEQVSWELP